FGLQGVELAAGSEINAQAAGYAADDSRPAKAGTVTLGTVDDGAITIDAAARIELGVLRGGDRLVDQTSSGSTYYRFAQGDLGGQLLIRAPIISRPGGDGVNVTVGSAASVSGASAIVLEAFRAWNLAAVAANPLLSGVTLDADGGVTLNTRTGLNLATGTYSSVRPNFLGGVDATGRGLAGTLPEFVQGFDVSASFPQLGGLEALPGFVARPGIELVHSARVTLASNWNLGAGVIDTEGAIAAGLMGRSALAPIAGSLLVPGQTTYVEDGAESELAERFTRFAYRTDDGSALGVATALTIRAGGDLKIRGTVTDGFFAYADYTAPEFLNVRQGGGIRAFQPVFRPGCSPALADSGSCGEVRSYADTVAALTRPGQRPRNFAQFFLNPGSFDRAVGSGLILDSTTPWTAAPYSPIANSAAALGAHAGGVGDPFSGAQLFPLIGTGADARNVDSTGYRFVAGAARSSDPQQ
ncbi:MAG: hypothetical protein ACRC1J_09650, partial [Sandaracinobacteroides sp.]